MPSAGTAVRVASGAMGAAVFRMSDAIEFTCRDHLGRRVDLSFRVSFAAMPERVAEAEGQARANLPVAMTRAMAVCDGVDFADDDCLVDCEHKLMGCVGEAMFGTNAPAGQVTRIAWSRVLFR